MFDRKAYKDIAKKQLQGRYNTPALATLAMLGVFIILYVPIYMGALGGEEEVSFGPLGALMPVILICLAGILRLAYSYLFIALSKTREKQPFSVFLNGFNYWLKGLLGFLWMILWLTLWAFCFYIPAIIKNYSYSQLFFILAEYPDLSVRQAMNLSKKITRGYKFDLFVMELSFLGWSILASFVPPVFLWLIPYKTMAGTNAYHSIKAQQIAAGVVKESDFSGNPADDAPDSGDGQGWVPSTSSEPDLGGGTADDNLISDDTQHTEGTF